MMWRWGRCTSSASWPNLMQLSAGTLTTSNTPSATCECCKTRRRRRRNSCGIPMSTTRMRPEMESTGSLRIPFGAASNMNTSAGPSVSTSPICWWAATRPRTLKDVPRSTHARKLRLVPLITFRVGHCLILPGGGVPTCRTSLVSQGTSTGTVWLCMETVRLWEAFCLVCRRMAASGRELLMSTIRCISERSLIIAVTTMMTGIATPVTPV
mmetsp:Transcript_18515/g.30865  ORF Transcript_18515/g.30865 Transcript_18515/m.30865 type:complete len:211 (-) Transcript_18515:736-1368(-)